MEKKLNIKLSEESILRVYNCFLGDKGVEFAKNNMELAASNILDYFNYALKDLSTMECDILRFRFCLDGNSHTLEEISGKFNISSERVREIEAKALRMLKHPTRVKALRHLLLGK